ncbi:MAG: hypothetical protein IJV72_04090 [Clostridia bacterium]|nr:hypothetical protein [Clostridia bacterium]
MKPKILISLVILLAFSLCLAACSSSEFEDEVSVMRSFVKERDDVTVRVLDKYEISDSETYYYIRWESVDGEENELLVIYDKSADTAEEVSLSDMSEEIKMEWDEVKNARPDRSFSQSEIDKIMNDD